MGAAEAGEMRRRTRADTNAEVRIVAVLVGYGWEVGFEEGLLLETDGRDDRCDLGLGVEPSLIDKRPSGGLCVISSHWRIVYLDGAIAKPRVI